MTVWTLVDAVALVLALASMGLGAWRGLVFELLSLLSWVAAFVAARIWGGWAGAALPMSGASPVWRGVAGFVAVFVAALVLGSLLAVLARKLLGAVGLRPLDRALGGFFGLLRAVVVWALVVVLVSLTPLRQTPDWRDARVVEWTLVGLKGVKPWVPSALLSIWPV